MNMPPVFTSGSAITINENATGAFYTATATDADGDALTFRLGTGGDSAQFSITGAGALSSRLPLDFEAPGDAERDNIYYVQILVRDGRNPEVSHGLKVTVLDAAEGGFSLRYYNGVTSAYDYLVAGPSPVPKRLYFNRSGCIRYLDPDGSNNGPTDVLGGRAFAFAPDVATSRYYYWTTPFTKYFRVQRAKFIDDNFNTIRGAPGTDITFNLLLE
jgi:hypothetical protein